MRDRVGGSSIRAEQGLQLLLAQPRGIDLGRCLLEHSAAATQLANGAARIDGSAASKEATSYYSTFTEEETRKGWRGGRGGGGGLSFINRSGLLPCLVLSRGIRSKSCEQRSARLNRDMF